MKAPSIKPVRCAIYTRVSTEHGLDQEFNSLDAQYEAASAYIKSQAHEGWKLIRTYYDDGGYGVGRVVKTVDVFNRQRRQQNDNEKQHGNEPSRRTTQEYFSAT